MTPRDRESQVRRRGALIERDKSEGEKRPEDKGMRKARQRPLTDDLGLAKNFQKKSRIRGPMGKSLKAGVFF